MVGSGIAYSRSPAMQNAAFEALGLDWTYDLLDVAPEALRDEVAGLRAPDVAGANVTIPYKQAVMEHLDVIAPEALRARAVNTIVNEGGRLGGYNTDIPAIRHNFGAMFSFADGHALIHKWRDSRTSIPENVLPNVGTGEQGNPDNPDILWIQQHTSAPK